MTPTLWILDSYILDRLTRYSRRSITDILSDQGHLYRVVERKSNGFYDPIDPITDIPVVLYGSHQFVKAINPDGRFQPGGLGVNDRTSATAYMSNLPLDWFLNKHAQFMTWSMFKHRAVELFDAYSSRTLFIRPNSGFKTFAGQVINLGTLDTDIETLDKLTGVMPETLIMINYTHKIQGEFRFVIVEGQVVTGSEYRWDGCLDIRIDYPESCFKLAELVAQQEWQVDIAYTCDIALTSHGPKIVELNGFSCAGLYACDLKKVVNTVSRAALKEWRGDEA